MTVKLTVVYGTPDDAAEFERHYFDVHMPLAQKLPGLQRTEIAKVTGGPGGSPSPYHLVAELHFADTDALNAALGSDEGRATGADFAAIAPKGSFMTVAEIVD
jgi:uncharacterized protein (TIGR02118 family)